MNRDTISKHQPRRKTEWQVTPRKTILRNKRSFFTANVSQGGRNHIKCLHTGWWPFYDFPYVLARSCMCHYLFLSTAGRGILLLFHLTLTFSWRTVLFNAMKYRSRITSLCFSLIAERAVVAVCVARACCSFTSTWRHSFNSFTSETRERYHFMGVHLCYIQYQEKLRQMENCGMTRSLNLKTQWNSLFPYLMCTFLIHSIT